MAWFGSGESYRRFLPGWVTPRRDVNPQAAPHSDHAENVLYAYPTVPRIPFMFHAGVSSPIPFNKAAMGDVTLAQIRLTPPGHRMVQYRAASLAAINDAVHRSAIDETGRVRIPSLRRPTNSS